MKLDFSCRVHTVNPSDLIQEEQETKSDQRRMAPSVVVLDAETKETLRLEFEFGCSAYCEWVNGSQAVREVTIIYRDDLEHKYQRMIRRYVKAHQTHLLDCNQPLLRARALTDFVKNVLWPTLRAGGAVVAQNLGFDISRISTHYSAMLDGRSFKFFTLDYLDKKTGKRKPSSVVPAIVRTAIDSKKSFYGLRFSFARKEDGSPVLSEEEIAEFRKSRFIDVRTVAFATTNESHSLESLLFALNAPADVTKLKYVPGPITPEKIHYCYRDVKATLWSLNTLASEFLRHPIDLPIDKAYSPVSLAKSYLEKMNITPPKYKFNIPPEIQAAAMEAFYAGRAETKIRKCEMPVVYLDFTSQYPSVFQLLRAQEFLIAESLTFEECTAEAQAFLGRLTLDDLFERYIWHEQLRFFAQVIPDGDILPVRAPYNGKTLNIAFNHFIYNRPVFYAGPQLAAAKILGNGKTPKVLKAFRVVPHGIQKDLKSVLLRGEVEIDPLKYDMARKVVETRYQVQESNRTLANFLKVMANGGMFYGLFAEVSPEREDEEIKVHVFTGDETFISTTRDVEKTGCRYCPILASQIVGGAHLLLAMAERVVRDAGGCHVLMDTDSIAVVSKEHGGFIPCPGGPHRMPDGREAIKALSWEETLDKVVAPFDRLHPYDRDAVKDHFLKVDKVNFGPDGQQRQLHAFSISSKRYDLHTYTADGRRVIVKVSAHGLGYLMPPFDDPPELREAEGRGEHKWIHEAWEWILARELDGEVAAQQYRKSWFDYPAMMQLTVTTPHVIKHLKHMPWARPMNFMNAPIVAHSLIPSSVEDLSLVGRYDPDPNAWSDAVYYDRHDGTPYYIGAEPGRVPYRSYGSILQSYRLHPESKFLSPDGALCGQDTRGLLKRMTVEGCVKHPLRKESNRRWAEGNDLSLIEDGEDDVTGKVFTRSANPSYHRSKRPFPTEVREWLKTISLKPVARELHIDRNSLRKGRDGKAVARSTQKKLLRLFRMTKRGTSLPEALKAMRLVEGVQVSKGGETAMPYKDVERKRQWEQQHREQRNARRRAQRLAARSGHLMTPNPAPDPVSRQKPQGTLKTILGWAVGIGVVLLPALARVAPPPPPPPPR
jgi:hypothetical protein